MLNSTSFKTRVLTSKRGTAVVEYVVLLAFIAVIAVFFATEWDEDYGAFEQNKFKPNNIATGVRKIVYNMYNLLTVARDMMP